MDGTAEQSATQRPVTAFGLQGVALMGVTPLFPNAHSDNHFNKIHFTEK